MAPPSNVRQSGEHNTPNGGQPVTYAHFNSFLEEFRGWSGVVSRDLTEVRGELSKGRAQFESHNRDIQELRAQNVDIENRTDEHSGKIKVLTEDKTVREALAEQAAEVAKPRKTILETIISTVVTAAILGFLALGYNAWRDSALDERERERRASDAMHKPPATHPAPAAVP